MSEDRWLADALANLASSDAVRLGPGDDAAVVDAGPNGVVVTTDALVDGVHFVLADCGPEAAARKAVGVNLSDLAAKGVFEALSGKIGTVLIVLGAMHFWNIWLFNKLRKRVVIEDAPPPVEPTAKLFNH